jgi:membrane associated rhomboid family serine protease
MDFISLTSLSIIIVTCLVSYQGFQVASFFDKYLFRVDDILIQKEYYRNVSVGFLHNDWQHLLFNMATLYAFAESVEYTLGVLPFLAIYFVSLIGGSLFTLYVHREHGDYSAVGASGAVCGVVFASIALIDGGTVSLMGAMSLPSWLYGALYILYCIYGINSKTDKVCHEGHFGGALCGLVVAILLKPEVLTINLLSISIIVIPSVIFIYMILTRPHLLVIGMNKISSNKRYYDIDDEFNAKRKNKTDEMDRILEKISKRGIKSLTNEEKDFLDNNA